MAKKKSTKAQNAQRKRQKRSAKQRARRKALTTKANQPPRTADTEAGSLRSDLPPIPDRRALEGTLASFAGARDSDEPVAQAQALMYEAWDASTTKEAARLAREAIRISPDCADAYNLLAETRAKSVEEAAELYRLGVKAGERALGPEAFEHDVGHFWGLLETRPYMRAREGLAKCLWSLGQREEAVVHYQAMLVLNPNDNQGIRHGLAAWLLALDHKDDLAKLLGQYEDDSFAGWMYTKALLAYRRDGNCGGSRELLQEAIEANPHVPAYLLGQKKMPKHLPDYMGLGDETEAMAFFVDYAESWEMTPGALKWLRENVR